MKIDLDAARAARAEKLEAHTLTLCGQEFTLPAEFPFAVGAELAVGNYDGALKILLDGQYDTVVKLGLNPGDLTAIVLALPEMYGFADEGKSSASASPSKRGGSQRRRTSNASTASTSETSGPAA